MLSWSTSVTDIYLGGYNAVHIQESLDKIHGWPQKQSQFYFFYKL